MAGSSLIALIDDIATILDDVSVMTKVATKKTAGVLGDDLALNAQQVTGVSPAREIPVVWAVAKGSLLNKVILVPAALAISFFVPWLVTPLLMLGGAFLCFEGFEKLLHKWLHAQEDKEHKEELHKALQDPDIDFKELERDKIRGAIRTDFILSAEIIAITLGTVTQEPIGMQFLVLSVVALLITVGVYGLVAGIVKLDDGGLYLSQRSGDGGWANAVRASGRGILWLAPYLMKGLSILGTAAMFLVGGGIVAHGIPAVHHFIEGLAHDMTGLVAMLTPTLANGVFGIVVGAVAVAIVTLASRGWKAVRS
ncbi:DUF808 domain-containing protein [Marinobacter zhejiangensis]|uniref:Inner membrane protein YedI n=1 Tax=Marinobacter zhejiangensis TaxID=488535 RepID=A0A1I4SIE9_9GAMM|nr:DUF808 domain-containing protein [Marinobacter zhejiangensis]SFM64121.1 hypothetical protein SAMN04487963_3233 [Marinobacter zhejiangensis]